MKGGQAGGIALGLLISGLAHAWLLGVLGWRTGDSSGRDSRYLQIEIVARHEVAAGERLATGMPGQVGPVGPMPTSLPGPRQATRSTTAGSDRKGSALPVRTDRPAQAFVPAAEPRTVTFRNDRARAAAFRSETNPANRHHPRIVGSRMPATPMTMPEVPGARVPAAPAAPGVTDRLAAPAVSDAVPPAARQATPRHTPPAPAATAPAETDLPEQASRSELLRLLNREISAGRRYPRIARRQGREGTATVAFQLHPNGRIDSIDIIRSSQFEPLDRAARAAVQAIEPFSAAGSYLRQSQSFRVDVQFALR